MTGKLKTDVRKRWLSTLKNDVNDNDELMLTKLYDETLGASSLFFFVSIFSSAKR